MEGLEKTLVIRVMKKSQTPKHPGIQFVNNTRALI